MKGILMSVSRTRSGSIRGRLGLAALACLTAGVFACRSGQTPGAKTDKMLSLATLTPIFGQAEGAASGLADFTQSDTEIVLSYHLALTDPTYSDAEIARDLAPRIRKLYGHFPRVDRVNFEISLPDQSAPDDWDLYVSFALTRKIVKETGWTDLLDTDLLSVARDVRRTR
jgi:hypothetical protein